jgi:hypothetical protein
MPAGELLQAHAFVARLRRVVPSGQTAMMGSTLAGTHATLRTPRGRGGVLRGKTRGQRDEGKSRSTAP